MRRRVFALFLAAVAPLATAPDTLADDAPRARHTDHSEHREMGGGAASRDRSLYQVPGPWTDQGGQPFALTSLRGSPVLLVLFYGTCDSVCPVVVRDVKKVEAMLPEADRRRTRFVLVTIDPEIDTPERLLAYARKNELDLSRWTLLNGPSEQVRVLANALGIRYRPTGTGQFSHTIRITVLDQEGSVVDSADGLERPLEPIAARISSLLTGTPPPLSPAK